MLNFVLHLVCVFAVHFSPLDQRDWRSALPIHLHFEWVGPHIFVWLECSNFPRSGLFSWILSLSLPLSNMQTHTYKITNAELQWLTVKCYMMAFKNKTATHLHTRAHIGISFRAETLKALGASHWSKCLTWWYYTMWQHHIYARKPTHRRQWFG